jgi:hypothetical protein
LPTPDDSIFPTELLKIIDSPKTSWSDADRRALTDAFRLRDPNARSLRDRTAALQMRQQALEEEIASCLVTKATIPRETRVLPRGNWMDTSGESVQPAIPALFRQPTDTSQRLTRRDLAEWIVSDTNPLTARVFVNHVWKHFFGTGLVRTPNDFGITGDRPSHPELLDTLAVEFMESGWNIKHLVAAIISTRAYLQSSFGRPDLEEMDPENRLFARQGRWRLEAEVLRDISLFASGILVTNVGGQACFPYQPEGHWDQLEFPRRSYPTSSSQMQYRRGLYVFRQRTFPHPALTIFDAPSREECVAERPVSNNALQALERLNNVSQVEAARMLYTMVATPELTVPQIITNMMQACLQRSPTADEMSELSGLFERQRQRAQAPDAHPLALLKTTQFDLLDQPPLADQAAWTAVARAILNLHETITRY